MYMLVETRLNQNFLAFLFCFVLFWITGKNQTMDWSTRLRVAYCVAESLDYCNTSGFASYSNLSAYKVLFDEVYKDEIFSCIYLLVWSLKCFSIVVMDVEGW